MRHLRPAVLVVAALTVAATAACEPIAIPDVHSIPDTRPGSALEGSGSGQCEPGWVCGTCPNGTSWGYLNDPQYTNDPQLSTLFFDNKHPCG